MRAEGGGVVEGGRLGLRVGVLVPGLGSIEVRVWGLGFRVILLCGRYNNLYCKDVQDL